MVLFVKGIKQIEANKTNLHEAIRIQLQTGKIIILPSRKCATTKKEYGLYIWICMNLTSLFFSKIRNFKQDHKCAYSNSDVLSDT